MNAFDPGPGWRLTTPEETEWPRATARIEYFEDGREIGWVREAPVPPLPTEPYTVIRAWWGTEASTELWLTGQRTWASQYGPYDADDMAALVRFEVLAEPVDARFSERAIRKATVLAVLDRIASEPWARQVDLAKWRREFGVES